MFKRLCFLTGMCLALFCACAITDKGSHEESTPEDPAPAPAVSQPEPIVYPVQTTPQDAVFAWQELDEATRERITGVSWQENDQVALSDLALLTISYIDFEGQTWTGQMIVARSLAQELTEIFKELYDARFPIEKIRLIDEYDADDGRSMADNNTSAFCYRPIDGTEVLSNHSYGTAVDINPVQNPYVRGDLVQPEAAQAYLNREEVRPGMIVRGDACYNAFVSRGWSWGGDWSGPIDYQHFEKTSA